MNNAAEKRNDRLEIADRIANRRIELGMTQVELADKLGLRQSSIAKLERRGVSTLDTLESVAKALDCSPEWLAWGDAANEPE